MSDDKQELEEELEMHFDDVEELEDIYEEDFGSFEDLEAEEAPPAEQDSAQSARRWLIIGFTGLVLAIFFRLFMTQTIEAHNDRETAAEEVTQLVNLANASAAQALTADGDFETVSESLASLEADVNYLISPPGFFDKRASAFFSDPNAVSNLSDSWQQYQLSSNALLTKREQVERVKQVLGETSNEISDTVTETIAFVEAVAKEGRSKRSEAAKDRYLFLTSEAANINGILSRLASGLRGYTLPNVDLARLSDTQNTLVVRLKDTLGRIIGNSAAVVATAAEPLQARFNSIETKLLELGDNAQAVSESRTAIQQMSTRGEAVRTEAANAAHNDSVPLIEVLSNSIPLIFLLIGLFSIWRFFRLQSRDLVQSEGSLSDALADQQESILKLLDEMSALADGDLTVEAEVTDQITGAIADSVNFAVIEMRELVSQINRASVEVANESEQAVSNAQSVSESNKTQAEQVRFAAGEMQRITESMREMSEQALSSAEMATESRNAAAQGTQSVRETIASMDNMREQIQDTSKRIKRLGESSQRIGDIVALIDDIAEQTNILSLNAAIQASMAGEAGRGFAVVSDEVQSLAERSTEATKKIAELVSTIQNDTNDAVASMEKATQQVISGTRVADSAGTALSEIERASNSLSELVELISKRSSEQALSVIEVAERVSGVSDSSTETSAKAQESANSIAKLLELAKELETSVSRFKLPAS